MKSDYSFIVFLDFCLPIQSIFFPVDDKQTPFWKILLGIGAQTRIENKPISKVKTHSKIGVSDSR